MNNYTIEFNKKISQYKKEGIEKIKIAFTDIDGVMRGKYISLEKFQSIVKDTAGFCDCILGWDMNDQLYDNTKFTGWHTAFPDALYKIDLTSERRLPDENNTPFFLIDLVQNDKNSLHPICPRAILKKVLEKLASMGYKSLLSFEYEFFVFLETAQTVREKNYQNLIPLTPGNFGYSIIRNSVNSDIFQEFMDYCKYMDFPVEGLHCETGPGVLEAALKYDEALKAADKAELFKTFTKIFFQKKGMIATFMAKWSMKYPGQSGHVHQSLNKKDTDNNLFFKKSDNNNMSPIMNHYVAGLQKHLKPFLIMTAPTINSYARLVKGAWAPTASTWGVDNRTTALRVIKGNKTSQRVEFRVGSADANPYLTAAANIAAGIIGMEQKLKLGPPVKGNAYEIQEKLPQELQFPSNLKDSIDNFSRSEEAIKMFGEPFTKHYISTRKWEVSEYEKNVNDWQLNRYFEII